MNLVAVVLVRLEDNVSVRQRLNLKPNLVLHPVVAHSRAMIPRTALQLCNCFFWNWLVMVGGLGQPLLSDSFCSIQIYALLLLN